MTIRYKNPPESPKTKQPLRLWIAFIARRLFPFKKIPVPQDHLIPAPQILANYQQLSAFNTLTWLGHNSFLIKMDNKNILTDPFFSNYASPVQGTGPRRTVPTALTIAQLPPIDILIVSHDHYDHLDLPTIKALPNKKNIVVIVPSKLGKYFYRCGYTQVHELGWYENINIHALKITALPAVHFSKRTVFTSNRTLWASFAIESGDCRLLFMCDSAYSPLYSKLGKEYGPFDYVLVGIGAYRLRELMCQVHTSPQEAIEVGKDLQAKNIVAMHWGTIQLADDPPFEPPEYFIAAGLKAGYTQEQLWVMKIGESRKI
ncbi:MAG: MBL fold metallo-hydrolase [Gammaproteobacteria bacterium]|nr:MBL fold metallo-hydrolase [Gammaproteobacteria bacterium]